jgi:hypothetical protein
MKTIYTKTIAGILITSFVFSFVFVAAPKKAEATIPVDDVGNTPTHLLTSISTHLTGGSVLGINLKDLTLDKIATAIAKAILQKLTLSVIDWINNGFQGSPAFVQNPTKFFTNIGDQILGSLISNGDLKFLCSPFNIDVRLALALNRASYYNPYVCTLSDVIKNSKNAVKGASINGFTAGDFKQGGWPAFATLTTQPQNTPNGAYLAAKGDLDLRIGTITVVKKEQLTQGSGFLSSEKCTDIPEPGDKNYVGPVKQSGSSADYANTQGGLLNPNASNAAYNNAIYGSNLSPSQQITSGFRKQSCTTQTPGSVISASLNKHLAVPTEELELANDINAVINAAFSQLIMIALNKGLAAITNDDANGGPSLASQINNLQSQQNQQQFAGLQSTLINSAATMIPFADRTKAARDQSLALELTTKNILQAGVACYTTASAALDPVVLGQVVYDSTLASYNYQIAQLQNIIAVKITPIDQTILAQDTAATQSAQYVYDIQAKAQSATTTEGLGVPNQEFLALAQSNGIPDDYNATKAEQDLTALHTTLDPVLNDAQNRLQSCPAYNGGN